MVGAGEGTGAPTIRQFVVADGYCGVLLEFRHDGQVDGRVAVAAVDGQFLGTQRVVAGHDNQGVEAVAHIAFALADGGSIDIVVGRIHLQRQRIDTVAAVGRGQGVVVDTCGGQDLAVPRIVLAAADGVAFIEMIDRIDGQDQVDGAVAAGIGLQVLGPVDGAHFGRRDVEAVLVVGFAQTDAGGNVGCLHGVHHEGQVDDAVTLCSGVEVVRVCAAVGQALVAEGVGQLVFAKGHCTVKLVARQDGEAQCVDAVAAGCGLEGARHGLRAWRGGVDRSAVVFHRSGLADGLRLVEVVNRVDRQHKMDGAVATITRGDDTVGVNGARGVGHDGEVGILVGSAGADGGCAFRRVEVMDGEVQHGGAVATVGGKHARLGVGARGVSVEAVERVGLASADVGVDDCLILVGHGEVQGEHAVATANGLQRIVVGAGSVQNPSIEIIGGRLADGLVDRSAIDRIHGQGQRRGAVAAVDVRVMVHQRADASCREGGVETKAGIMFFSADHVIVCDIAAVVDGQMQSYGAVAAMDGLEVLHLVAARRVVLVVPGVAVTSCLAEFGRGGIVDGQVQRHGAVATMDGLEVLNLVTACRVVFVVPGVAVASGCTELGSGGLVDGQIQGYSAVAAVGSNECLSVGTGCAVSGAVPSVVDAGLVGESVGLDFFHMDGEGHEAVATVGGLCAQDDGGVTRLIKGGL